MYGMGTIANVWHGDYSKGMAWGLEQRYGMGLSKGTWGQCRAKV